jgi:toxin ParE1/3/4
MAVFPQSGRLVPEKKDPLIRETLVGSYRIIYRVDEAQQVVALARILHSARGTPEL